MKTKKPLKKGNITPLIPTPCSKEYSAPDLTIKSKITADAGRHPTISSGVAELKACVTDATKKIMLSHRTTAVVDCGFSVDIPDGYKAVMGVSNAWANRGLCSPRQQHIKTGRVKLMVTNIGKEVIVVTDGDIIGDMWIEPIYKLEWIGDK